MKNNTLRRPRRSVGLLLITALLAVVLTALSRAGLAGSRAAPASRDKVSPVTQVSEGRVWLGSRHTRLTFGLSRRVSPSLFALTRPERLVVDLPNARLAAPLRPHAFSGSLVAGMSTTPQDGNRLRIVLDLTRSIVPQARVTRTGGAYQLVLDLYERPANPLPKSMEPLLRAGLQAKPTRQRVAAATSAGDREPVRDSPRLTGAQGGGGQTSAVAWRTEPAPVPDNSAHAPAARAQPVKGPLRAESVPDDVQSVAAPPVREGLNRTGVQRSESRPAASGPADHTPLAESLPGIAQRSAADSRRVKSTRDIVVVIDAGHGGQDPGATGPSGVQEKQVTLAIAHQLAGLVNSEPHMRAVLTRQGDIYLPLRERTRIARSHKADLFVSIHADAYTEMDASGSSVFVLSERGASSEAARWLAERENAADLIGGVSLDDRDDTVAAVLLDLSQSAAIEASVDAASQVLGALRRVGNIHKQEVQFAGFAVLKSPDMPSMLIETAFITNPGEERRLSRGVYQTQIARAVMQGIRAYFAKRTPTTTVLAEREPALPAAEEAALSAASR